MNGKKCRKVGAVWAISQGLLTALVPQLSIAILKRMLGTNFDGVENLQAKPAYLRQLRAMGIGVAAAGIASLVMERVAADETDSVEDED